MKTVIEMAREAGLLAPEGYHQGQWVWGYDNLEALVALVRKADAERIAILDQDNANCRKAVSDLMDDIQKQRAAMQMAQPQDNLNCKSVQARLATSWGYVKEQPQCNPHPDAPHGFDRNASHSADRYVCECESWAQPQDHSEQHLNVVQGEWVDLTIDEIAKALNTADSHNTIDSYRAVITKFKEKNTPPSVEAAIEATKERCAQMCEQRDFECHESFGADCAAAIRSMR